MNDQTKFGISLIVDALGVASYLLFGAGEFTIDIFTGIIEYFWILYAYKQQKYAVLGGLEEFLPFTDILPMSSITHIITMNKTKEKSIKGFEGKHISNWVIYLNIILCPFSFGFFYLKMYGKAVIVMFLMWIFLIPGILLFRMHNLLGYILGIPFFLIAILLGMFSVFYVWYKIKMHNNSVS